jgi:hypothetical protein
MLDPSNPRDVLAFRVDFEDRVAVLVVLLQAVPAGDAAIDWLPQHRAHVWTRPMTLGGPAEDVA